MSRLAALLPDFSQPVPRAPVGPTLTEAEVDACEARAYEKGYRAGWDDAVASRDADHDRLSADFAQNLKDLSFTYHEAYSHVLRAMTPLLEDIVTTILPAAVDDALAAHVVGELQNQADRLGGMSVKVSVAPEQLPLVEPVVMRDVGFPVELLADGALTPGQADIRLADREIRIDLGEIAEGIRTAITEFNHAAQGARAHG
jgi:flagellar assembly protein FliH